MQNITLKIPDNKVAFFLELVKNLGFAKVEQEEFITLSEKQIQSIEKEREKIKANPDYLLDWEEAKTKFNV